MSAQKPIRRILSLEMSPITINTDGISDEQKKNQKFKFVHEGMLAQLSEPGFIEVLCAHEAAHKLYIAVTGVQNFEFTPAHIEYDPQTDNFVGVLASVRAVDKPPPAKTVNEVIFNMARMLAAGGVVARKLRPNKDAGDKDDKDRFRAFCAELSRRANLSIDVEHWWKQGQDYVIRDLEKPELLDFLKEEGRKIKNDLGY